VQSEEYSEKNPVTLLRKSHFCALGTDRGRMSQNRALMSESTLWRALTRLRELRDIHRTVTYAESESFSSLARWFWSNSVGPPNRSAWRMSTSEI